MIQKEMERGNNGIPSRNASMMMYADESYYGPEEHMNSTPRPGMTRPSVGQYLSGQRFTATSRLIPESHQLSGGYGTPARVIGGIATAPPVGSPYAVGGGPLKRPFSGGEYFDCNFRIKFPRHTDKSRGLRHFSNKVCEKVKEKGQTNYNEVAEELVAEYFDSLPDPPNSLEKQQYDTKNIRRRVYDALNVLMAMNIIEKDKKEIHWVGLPTSSLAECRRLEDERAQRQERLRQKTEQLQELIIQLVAYKSLVQRNRERERTCGRPADAAILYLPYIIVNTEKKTMVDCAISSDKTEYWFNFDRPFEIHDDIEVLKRLGLAYGLDSGQVDPENVNHVKSCLPPALRDYVDQIMEGSLSGGAISKAGKSSQTVVISSNQHERRPIQKYVNPENFGSAGHGPIHQQHAPTPQGSAVELAAGVTYGGSGRTAAAGGGAIGASPMARYAVVPRSSYGSGGGNQVYPEAYPHYRYPQCQPPQKMSQYGYSADRSTRSQYGGSSSSHYAVERGHGGRASYGSYQDYRQVQQQQQMYAGHEAQDEYMGEELYEEETVEYQ